MENGVINGLIGAVTSLIVTIIIQIFALKKNNADAAGTVAEATVQLLQPLRDQITILQNENAKIKDEILGLQKELADWQDWAKRLEGQIRSLGYEPIKRQSKGR